MWQFFFLAIGFAVGFIAGRYPTQLSAQWIALKALFHKPPNP